MSVLGTETEKFSPTAGCMWMMCFSSSEAGKFLGIVESGSKSTLAAALIGNAF